MKTICFILLALITPTFASADDFRTKPPIKWGKVNEFEKQLKVVDYEQDASAVILCHFGSVEISNRTFYRRHIRIKILNQEGINHATVEIPYQFKNRYDDVSILKAQVLNISENGKVESSNVNYKDIHDIQIDEYKAVKRFSFPDVRVGSIIEYQYEIASMDFVKLDDWLFQNEIPTLWSEIRFNVPQPFIYLFTYQKGPELTDKEKTAFSISLEWLKNTKWRKARAQLLKNDGILFTSEKKNYIVHVINKKRKKIVHRSLPSLPDNKNKQVALNRAPRIRFHLLRSEGILPPFYKPLLLSVEEDFEDMTRQQIRFEIEPAGYIHYRLENWVQMNNQYLNSERFGRAMMKHINYIPIFEEIITESMSANEKLNAITGYVRSHVLWNGMYDSHVRRDLNEVLTSGEGSSSELNFLLLTLLKRAGLEVAPVLVKTVDQGRVEEVYPVWKQFNHVQALVTLDNKQLLIDLTVADKKRGLPVNPEGWIVKKTNFGWINIIEPIKRGEKYQEGFVVTLLIKIRAAPNHPGILPPVAKSVICHQDSFYPKPGNSFSYAGCHPAFRDADQKKSSRSC